MPLTGTSPAIVVRGSADGMWVFRKYCTPISFPVVVGQHWVFWTMNCYLQHGGGFGDADGNGTIYGGEIEGVVPGFETQATATGLYELEVATTGTLTFTPGQFPGEGGEGDTIMLMAHLISGPFDFLFCE